MPSLVGLTYMLVAAQVTPAAVAGTIRDAESAAPIAGALVVLVDINRSIVSDSGGRYVLRGVPPGPHHLSVRRIGFTPRTLHALVPTRGELRIDIALHAEPVVLGTVDVRPLITVRGVEESDSTAFPNRGISLAAVRNHPMLAEPDVLMALGGGDVVLRPESPSGMHLRGGASDQTAYELDGIPVLTPYHAAGLFSAWNPDALEWLELSSSGTAEPSDALSGVVRAETRTPGSEAQLQGSVSTTQWRATVDGPLAPIRGGYLLSFRSGFPDALSPRGESSYLSGESSDLLGKVELPAFGGRLQVLGYESANEIGSAADFTEDVEGSDAPARNSFEWISQSLGGAWSGHLLGLRARVKAWSASASANALWSASDPAPVSMRASRRDRGVLMSLEHRTARTATRAGVRLTGSMTSYVVRAESAEAPLDLSVRTPLASVFVSHQRPLAARLSATLAVSATSLEGDIYSAPQALLRWSARRGLTITGSYGRSHQFSQSLRNSESVVANVFPVDLFLGTSRSGVPVARSDLGVVAAEYRFASGARVGAQGYARVFEGLLLVAPRSGDPFSTGDFTAGSGSARGFAVDAAVSRTRYALVGSYGLQRLRFTHHDTSFVPEHGASHVLEAGVIVFPSTTSSIRVGATSILGRRTTPVSGILEWEACNLYDRGCELVGTPRHATSELGGQRLPPYLRIDVGARKHWHLRLASRDATVAVFGTITNVLGRKNLLTISTNPDTGEREEVAMRSRVPLVVGVDWRF